VSPTASGRQSVNDAGVAQTRRERFIRKLAGLVVRGVYRRVDVFRADDVTDGPLLSVSNHFGGFTDPLLLIYAMPRLPRIIARDVIWKYPIVRSIMNWAGAIAVHKPEDHGPGSNDIMFRSAYGALGEGSHVIIFPEGITRDEPSIARIKTGAARIVLGARATGIDGIRITPAGIHYEDKASLRSDVSVLIGHSIDLDDTIDDHVASGEDEGPDNRPAVRSLTDSIETELRRVAPDFTDWREARTLTTGAEILLRTLANDPRDGLPSAERDALAGHLGRKPAEEKSRVITSVDRYSEQLSSLGLDDAQLLSGMTGSRFLWRSLGWLILTAILLPFALVGAAINWIPYLIVKAVGLLRVAPAMLSTIKPVSAIFVFGVTWGITLWGVFREVSIQAALLAGMLLPLYLGAVILFLEKAQLLWSSFRTWRRLRRARSSEDAITAARREVLDVLVEAL
jgi:1-acyl-sn-glycerol-3-phosphate acyltransferase